MSSSGKEIQNVFRFCRQLLKAKQAPSSGAASSTTRYTNFTLQHAWEKFDCQTQLLQREALVPLMKRNPELLDLDVDLQYGTNHPQNVITYADLKRPSGAIISS
jgi:hypothetical protein